MSGPSLGKSYLHQDYSHEKPITDNLQGFVFVVEPSRDDALKHRLERIAVKHGAIINQNVPRIKKKKCFYVQTSNTVKAKNVIRQGAVDVIKFPWLLDCEIEYRYNCSTFEVGLNHKICEP